MAGLVAAHAIDLVRPDHVDVVATDAAQQLGPGRAGQRVLHPFGDAAHLLQVVRRVGGNVRRVVPGQLVDLVHLHAAAVELAAADGVDEGLQPVELRPHRRGFERGVGGGNRKQKKNVGCILMPPVGLCVVNSNRC